MQWALDKKKCVWGRHCLFQSVSGRVVFINNWYNYFGIMVMSGVNFSIIDDQIGFFHPMMQAASGFYLVLWRINRWSHVAHVCADEAYDGLPAAGGPWRRGPLLTYRCGIRVCFGFLPCVASNQKPDVWDNYYTISTFRGTEQVNLLCRLDTLLFLIQLQ